jgi:hypothetical protein
LVVGVIGIAIYRRFRPADRFGFFLCHHKAGAGALARQMKMIIEPRISYRVFLDSDQLEDLDLIFDTVRAQTLHLAILLSPELLLRMWCAGEIVTAHRNQIPITPVICDGFVTPNEEQIMTIPSVWTEEQRATLGSFDITVDMITDAYKHVTALPVLNLPRVKGLQKKEQVCEELIGVAKLQSLFTKMGSKSTGGVTTSATRKPRVVIMGAVSNVEAVSACEIAQVLLQRSLDVEIEVVRSVEDIITCRPTVHVVMVLLTGGLLTDSAFAEFLLEVLRGKEDPRVPVPDILTVSADTSFQFPTGEFYSELERRGLGTPGLGPEQGPQLSAAFRSLLSILALPFNALGSKGLIDQQISEVGIRARKLLAKERTEIKEEIPPPPQSKMVSTPPNEPEREFTSLTITTGLSDGSEKEDLIQVDF